MTLAGWLAATAASVEMQQKFRTKNKQNLNTHFQVPNSPDPGCNSPAADAGQPTKTNNKMPTNLSKNKTRKSIVLHGSEVDLASGLF
jgi:hypothetical protein